VTREDLGDLPNTTLTFSVDRGNILHAYGDDVVITQVEQSPIILQVAVKATKSVRVQTPVLKISDLQWEAKVNLLSEEVEVTGPSAELEKLKEVTPQAIPTAWLLRGRENEEEFDAPVGLSLADEYAGKLIKLVSEDGILCEVQFKRSREPRSIQVPISVYTAEPESPIVVELPESPSPPVEKSDGSFVITLTFRGFPRDLDAVEAAVEEGKVRAYVRAEDAPVYDKPPDELEEGTYYINRLRVFVEGKPPRVSYAPPTEDVEVYVRKRKSK
jgi:hypothetical protein